MNPFLESTVAAAEPDARWCRFPARRSNVASRPLQASRVCSPSGIRLRRAGRCRQASQAGRLLRVVTLAGSLLAPGLAPAVDVNSATPDQLLEVKGIGPKMARVIIEERDRGGRFTSMDDLSERVRGIGPKKAASLQASGLTINAGAGGVSAGAPAAGAGVAGMSNPGTAKVAGQLGTSAGRRGR